MGHGTWDMGQNHFFAIRMRHGTWDINGFTTMLLSLSRFDNLLDCGFGF
jgi:hypothetical protein